MSVKLPAVADNFQHHVIVVHCWLLNINNGSLSLNFLVTEHSGDSDGVIVS